MMKSQQQGYAFKKCSAFARVEFRHMAYPVILNDLIPHAF